MSDIKIKVGITHGELNGIGYEVIIKALSDPRMCEICTPILYGSSKAVGFYRKEIEEGENFNVNLIRRPAEANHKRINLIDCCTAELRIEPGVLATEGGIAATAALKAAAADLKAGEIDVIVTAPICKENMHEAGFGFMGHTEFFAAEFGGEPLMLMCSDLLKVGLQTIHIPIEAVASSLSIEKIVTRLHRLRKTLIADFSIHEPRIAVLGLNPHAGDGGIIGAEEKTIILPAIQQASREGVLAFGPFAADGFFASAGYTKYDAVLAMYHDQGLAPFKALSSDGVNFTAGIPVVRTSPAHGTGFDIAGSGKADETSMRNAIYMAIDIFRSRRQYERISANPLQKFRRETGADVSAADLPQTDPES